MMNCLLTLGAHVLGTWSHVSHICSSLPLRVACMQFVSEIVVFAIFTQVCIKSDLKDYVCV